MSESQRREPRYRVHLNVRYQYAIDFVQEYAENLSKGGLFIRGAADLEPRAKVMVEIGLPGYGSFKVEAEVAHVLDAETAQKLGRKPGAGLAVTRSPANYERALRSYLRLLGQRRDCVVFSDDPVVIDALETAGYDSHELPPADNLTNVLAYAPKPVLGVVVTQGTEADIATPMFKVGMADRLHTLSDREELETLFPRLDERIPRT